ncbi:hypothetical protein ACVW1A_000562 [Bradyrhizobium sp. LB1.3]
MKGQRPSYFSDMQEPPEFLKALDQARRLSCFEGWCRMHIEAIQVAIDQYAEAALGNREFFPQQAAQHRWKSQRRRAVTSETAANSTFPSQSRRGLDLNRSETMANDRKTLAKLFGCL